MKVKTRTETLTLQADGFAVTITRAPLSPSRYERGIAEILRRSRVTANVVLSWREFAEYGLSLGVICDPLSDQPEEDGVARRYVGPGALITAMMSAGLSGPKR